MRAPVQRLGPRDGLPLEGGTHVGPVDRAVRRDRNADEGADGGEDVGADHRDVADEAGPDLTRPADEAGHADPAFVAVALPAAQAAGRAPVSVVLRPGVLPVRLSAAFRPVVRREEDNRVSGQAQFVQGCHQRAEGPIELRDVPMVLAQAHVGRGGILRHEARVRLDRQVRLMRPDSEEEPRIEREA